jgi:N-methylhydantoinase A/oxoprolinase/acetone carboxylase beta subunit
MSVRIGVDVGGTFTKAIACEASSGAVAARAIIPTTHESDVGVAEGVVHALRDVARQVAGNGADRVLLVAHSTSQAVNALLEGDTAEVGVLGVGRRPDLGRARRRTRVGEVRLAPGRTLRTHHAFVDASDGVDAGAIERALVELEGSGATAVCVSESFGVEDSSAERLALEIAAQRGIPACGGHELSGLYGLELRTVTGALNASILPTGLRTASVVEKVVQAELPHAPVLVMRGDGGASDLRAMRRQPLLTAFSGPAASVTGALRHLALTDAVVVEVGGTSTNVSVVRGGRPVLAYVRVLEHVTCVRSLDVRVVGVAGGSLVSVGSSFGRLRIEDVGPRSAHIAGLEYACFASPNELDGAQVRLIAPRPGDPECYAVLETAKGRRLAVTLTCAANAVDAVPAGAYARANRESARRAFETLGSALRRPWRSVAEATLAMAARKVHEALAEVVDEHEVESPVVAGLGGGAGALVPAVARAAGLDWRVPPDAEIISSIGDALSLVRVEVERHVSRASPGVVADLHDEAEQAAVDAGAAPSTLQVETESVPQRRYLRAVATGSVALEASALPGDRELDDEALRVVAKAALKEDVELVARNDFYATFAAAGDTATAFAVVDRRGSLAVKGWGEVVAGPGDEMRDRVASLIRDRTRRFGPVTIAPGVRLLRGARLIDFSMLSAPDKVLQGVVAECALAGFGDVVAFVSRS